MNGQVPPDARAALTLVGVVLGLFLGGCGNGESPTRVRGTSAGRAVGQEIWITYRSRAHAQQGRRTGIEREQALETAEGLRRRVLAGEDVGVLARAHSNAPGGCADGYSAELPGDRKNPDARDLALLAAPVGGVTPIVDWRGGYWFAKRVGSARAQELRTLFERRMRERVRFRSIALLYVGAYIPDALARKEVSRSKQQAIATAESLLRRLREGGDFGALARQHSADQASAARGGLVVVTMPGEEPTEWIAHGNPYVPAPVLDAAFATSPGELHPEIIVTDRGIFIVRVEALRLVEPPPARDQ